MLLRNTSHADGGALYSRLMARVRARHLQVLVSVAELGSVRQAGEALHLTQPAVTKVIADIEQLLGTPLFLRHSRGVQPNLVCLQLLPAVRRLLIGFRDIAEQVAHLGAQSNTVARVLASSSAVTGVLVSLLPEFSAAHSGVLVQLSEIESPAAVPMLLRKEADLAVCTEPAVLPEGWWFEPLLTDHFVVLAGPRHPLATRVQVPVAELLEYEWLAAPVGSASHAVFETLFAGGPLPRLRPISARVSEVLWAMLTATELLAVVPASVSRQLVDAGLLATVDCPANFAGKDIGLVIPGELTGAAQRFCEFCRART